MVGNPVQVQTVHCWQTVFACDLMASAQVLDLMVGKGNWTLTPSVMEPDMMYVRISTGDCGAHQTVLV